MPRKTQRVGAKIFNSQRNVPARLRPVHDIFYIRFFAQSADGDDIVMNTALPGKPQLLVFVCPETQGSYRGFAYDAIAISYYNDAVLRLLDNSAFQGNASNYVIYPDGRVVIDNSVNRKEIIYNFIAMLRDHSDLSEEQILDLSEHEGKAGRYQLLSGLRGHGGPELDDGGACPGQHRQCQSG